MVAADEVSIKVTGQNTSTPAVDSAKRGIKGLKDEAGETSVKVRVLGESVKSTTRATDDLGDKARRTAREVSALDRKILELRASTLALGRQFEATGDTGLLKKFRSDSRELAGLERTRKQISGLAGDVKDLGREAASSASTFSSLFQGGIINALKSPAGAVVAGAVGVPAVIGAGATIGGAVTAGAGLGVVGAGVAGAMQSEKVAAEWTRTIADIKSEWLDASTSFEAPTISAIGKIRQAVLDINMKKTFEDASKFVEPLADGAAKAARLIGQGIEYLVSHGEPAIAAISNMLGQVGGAVKIAFEQIGGGSEGGAKALRDLGTAISDTIIVTGYWIGWLEDAYDALDKFRNKVADVHPVAGLLRDLWTDDGPKTLARRLDDVSAAADHAGGSTRYLSGGLADMTSEARLANDAFTDLFSITMNLDEANLRVREGMAELKKTAQEGGATHDEVTEKVLRQIQALKEQRDAQLSTGDSSQAATDRINANFRAQLEQLKKMFPWLAALIDKYEELAKPLTKHIDIVIQERRIGSVSVEGVISGGDQRRQAGRAYASGGIVGAASGMVLSGLADVAERGREIALLAPGRAMLPPGSQVLSNANTEQALAGGGGGDLREIVLRVEGGAGDALFEVMEVGLRTGKLRAFAKAS